MSNNNNNNNNSNQINWETFKKIHDATSKTLTNEAENYLSQKEINEVNNYLEEIKIKIENIRAFFILVEERPKHEGFWG